MESNHTKSIFVNEAITKEGYTRVWINLINQLEKKKSVVFSSQTQKFYAKCAIISLEENSTFLPGMLLPCKCNKTQETL